MLHQFAFSETQTSRLLELLQVDLGALSSANKFLAVLEKRLGAAPPTALSRTTGALALSRSTMPTLAQLEREHAQLTAEQRQRQTTNVLTLEAERRKLKHELQLAQGRSVAK